MSSHLCGVAVRRVWSRASSLDLDSKSRGASPRAFVLLDNARFININEQNIKRNRHLRSLLDATETDHARKESDEIRDINHYSETCSFEKQSFELVTGYVFTAPDDTLELVPGTLHLTECLSYCRHNASCRAVNFETGLCVLFSSSATDRPDALTSSQFPVFTIYAQKICLRELNSDTNERDTDHCYNPPKQIKTCQSIQSPSKP
ncbi:apple domain-containing protein [Trichonephila clavipes]|nr:apple domain-containing protein [Trichonephila clavipes]